MNCSSFSRRPENTENCFVLLRSASCYTRFELSTRYFVSFLNFVCCSRDGIRTNEQANVFIRYFFFFVINVSGEYVTRRVSIRDEKGVSFQIIPRHNLEKSYNSIVANPNYLKGKVFYRRRFRFELFGCYRFSVMCCATMIGCL